MQAVRVVAVEHHMSNGRNLRQVHELRNDASANVDAKQEWIADWERISLSARARALADTRKAVFAGGLGSDP